MVLAIYQILNNTLLQVYVNIVYNKSKYNSFKSLLFSYSEIKIYLTIKFFALLIKCKYIVISYRVYIFISTVPPQNTSTGSCTTLSCIGK